MNALLGNVWTEPFSVYWTVGLKVVPWLIQTSALATNIANAADFWSGVDLTKGMTKASIKVGASSRPSA
eukprot:gene25863-32371_t